MENSSQTRRERFKTGDIVQWNKGKKWVDVFTEEKIEELENLINIYETEANFVLSESNAVTKISV